MTAQDIARGSGAGMANIYARFHQYLARRIQQELPGKRLYLMAYYNAQYAGSDPRWTLPPNTEVNLCLGGLPNKIHNPEERSRMLRIAGEWYESLGKRPVQKLWLYTGTNPFVLAIDGENVREIPGFLGKYLGRTGLFYDHCSSGRFDWFFYPSFYAAYRSMWNPQWDSAKAIDLHWDAFYGKDAGGHLREFHVLLRRCYERQMQAVGSEDADRVLYSHQEIQAMEGLIAAARKAVAPGSIEEKRLKLILTPWPKALQSMRNRLDYERPVYGIRRLADSERQVLDGRGGESFWGRIGSMPLMDPLGSNASVRHPASLKLAWNQEGILGLFSTEYGPVALGKNGIWKNDNYEVILSPGMNKEVEYQFVFDPLKQLFFGYQRHLPIPQPFDSFWKAPGFRLESSVNAKGWTAEFFIPFSVFNERPPKAYECWTCNVVRNKRGAQAEYSGTSMTLGNNHNMDMFGIVKFLGKGE